MGKIIIAELIRMDAEGIKQKEIAARFNVSPSAVNQALMKLKQEAARPAIFDRISIKELKFATEIANGSSQTQAALVAYDVSSRESAKSLGCTLMKSPEIQEAVTAIMESVGLGNRALMMRLRDHVSSADTQASLRAIDMGFKVNGTYAPTKAINVHAEVCPIDLSKYA